MCVAMDERLATHEQFHMAPMAKIVELFFIKGAESIERRNGSIKIEGFSPFHGEGDKQDLE